MVQVSVVSKAGRQAVVAMLGPGEFFGEGCLAGQTVRMGSASAVEPTTVMCIDKKQLSALLHQEHPLSDRFIRHMLARNIRIEQDLIDHLFNSSEKRLARKLLLLARYGNDDRPTRTIPPIAQSTLAEMVGTTRSRVNFFMRKFRRLGFVDYDDRARDRGTQFAADRRLARLAIVTDYASAFPYNASRRLHAFSAAGSL